MNKLIFFAVCITAGFLASWLFYSDPIGINLAIFEIPLLAYIFYFKRKDFTVIPSLYVFSGFMLTICAVILVNSTLAISVHSLFFTLLAGALAGTSIKSFHYMLAAGIEKFPFVLTVPFRSPRAEDTQSVKILKPFYIFRLSVIPLLLIFFFMLLYAWAVPRFGNILLDWISNWPEINIRRVVLFFSGLLGAAFLLYKSKNSFFVTADKNSNDFITRIKQIFRSRPGAGFKKRNTFGNYNAGRPEFIVALRKCT